MPEDSSSPMAKIKRLIVVTSATLLSAMERIDGNQYLVVMAGILSVLGVNQAMNGNRN